MKPPDDNTRAIAGHCAICGADLAQPAGGGRKPITCSPAHKQELYRRRRAARLGYPGASEPSIEPETGE